MKGTKQDYVKSCFNNVANKYDEIPFFKISAKYVVEMIQEKTTMKNLKVLDVACGTGNVVLECASCLPMASFDAVDISEGMLVKAKENASSKDLSNIEFYLQDVTTLALDKKYHVITCSYALFFLPDAPSLLHTLTTLLKPEGFVIFTSFTTKAFNTSNEILLPLLKEHGSATTLTYEMDKWENLRQVKDIEKLCNLAKVNTPTIISKEIRYGMCLDEWWELLNNTGYKGMLMELNAHDYEKVKIKYYEAMFGQADMDGEVELVADTYFVVVK